MATYMTVPDQYKQILGMTADDYAKQQTAGLTAQSQQYLNDYNNVAEQRKQALNTAKANAVQQLNNQITTATNDAKGQSKQAYINNMMSQKDMKQQLSQAGLSNTGVVGSAYGDLASNYAENLNTINANKSKTINDVNNNINSTNLDYAGKEQDLLADIENSRIEMNKYNNQLAQTQYQQAIDNYMKYKGIEDNVNSYNLQMRQLEEEKAKNERDYQLAVKQYEASKNSSANFGNTDTSNLDAILNAITNSTPKSAPIVTDKVLNNKKAGVNPLTGVTFADAVKFNAAQQSAKKQSNKVNTALGLW